MDKHRDEPLLFTKDEGESCPDPAEQALNLLALSMVKGIGPATLRSFCKNFANLSDVWNAQRTELLTVLRSSRTREGEKLVDTIRNLHDRLLDGANHAINRLNEQGIHILVDSHPLFPERLHQIPSRPFWLFVEGDPTLLSRKSLVAVVGTRRASSNGISLTKMLTKELVRLGFVVVSGLAEGIDTAAHSTVLEYGGYTIAVLGNGLNIDFPASNKEVRRRIVATGGAIVTDHFPDTMYSAPNFVKRNRIIAGLSGAVIPVESKIKSGTAHTIKFAEECHRLLIGVIGSKHQQQTTENEIPMMLQDKGHPSIDLDSPQGFEYLHRLLTEFEADATPKKVDTKAQREACYSEVLLALKKALELQPLDEDGLQWLIDNIRNIAGEM